MLINCVNWSGDPSLQEHRDGEEIRTNKESERELHSSKLCLLSGLPVVWTAWIQGHLMCKIDNFFIRSRVCNLLEHKRPLCNASQAVFKYSYVRYLTSDTWITLRNWIFHFSTLWIRRWIVFCWVLRSYSWTRLKGIIDLTRKNQDSSFTPLIPCSR